ncbi:S8 family serine peptidase [Anaeromyxobacter dehalogenans]|uniref:S8 family serine peptidase n=1 Tax=Anaeromyxobacter dehalogenans TaxID=161493 RepID=UPI0022B566D8|nr:S8 family serine peptidase [Anaeromyxobacter dehalogenans]
MRQPGHGTGTISILAGRRIPQLANDWLGGAPAAEVIPVRIANSVVLFRTSALARALDYALRPYTGDDAAHPGTVHRPVDVVTLSMGGVASRAWAEAVNAAYEAGVCIVAAAGNNFALGPFGVPTRFIVHPARFGRVIAACGIMANWRPYFGLPTGKMQGCWGPPGKMATALAAFTPNMPWAEMGAPQVVDMNGAGTSSATPQIAAAAALWIAAHRPALQALAEPWRRVEAVRHALFTSAERPSDPEVAEKVGRGVLQARAALAVAPVADLPMTPRDTASLSLLRVLTGLGAAPDARLEMLALEATQLTQLPVADATPNPFEALVPDPDAAAAGLSTERLRQVAEALLDHPRASAPLRAHLSRVRQDLGGARPAPPPAPRPPAAAIPAPAPGAPAPLAPEPPRPLHRQLTAFAFDPSVAQRLDTRDIGTVTLRVPWEPLAPGPVGEYLEVVDVDPTSQRFYAPVDLDHPHLLAQQGLAPSEGAPQFHQQMAYAVASLTIDRFEKALGRKALWSPRELPERPQDDSTYVPRLRVYPHALREANAYYSPARKALLFGYFRASEEDPGDHLPGSFVFTALSQDIAAHETAHALLDGMHRRFNRPTNLDMQAFHEAFADVVALLQHFTFPEIVRDQVARTRGALRTQANLLGALATEFGRAMGTRAALRDYIGRRDPVTGVWARHVPDPAEYEQAREPHARGAILVSAVFDAFLSIYERRTRDLVRIATGGSGVLPAGDLQPDLVNRLAEEAARTADQVLRMCIRALDYCPPVDLTFGEYLRALVTADRDLVPDDDLGYRLAFVEAFRRRAIYPRDVRTLSEDALLWRGPVSERGVGPSPALVEAFAALRPHARSHLDASSREVLFHRARALRAMLHERLKAVLAAQPPGSDDALLLGLDLEAAPTFQVHSARFAERIGPDGQHLPQCIVELLQHRDDARSAARPDLGPVRFEGGATVVVALREGDGEAAALRWVIRKSLRSASRLERQVAFGQSRATGSGWDTYFGARALKTGVEPFAAIHRS